MLQKSDWKVLRPEETRPASHNRSNLSNLPPSFPLSIRVFRVHLLEFHQCVR